MYEREIGTQGSDVRSLNWLLSLWYFLSFRRTRSFYFMFADICIFGVCMCVHVRMGGWFSSSVSSCPYGGLVTSNRTLCRLFPEGEQRERLEWGQSHPSFPVCLVASIAQTELPLFYPLHLSWTLHWAFRSDNNTSLYPVISGPFLTKTIIPKRPCNLFLNSFISQYHLSINMFSWKPSFRFLRREVHQTMN